MKIVLTFILFGWYFITNAQKITVTNDAQASGRKGYYKWAVYLSGHRDTLKKIDQVVYTLSSSFKNPVQPVTSIQSPIFKYCASGWGEFDIKVKIIFRDRRRPPFYLIHHLNLRTRKTTNLCL
jgi:transcription initiation factor IIF auxiliary subunit